MAMMEIEIKIIILNPKLSVNPFSLSHVSFKIHKVDMMESI